MLRNQIDYPKFFSVFLIVIYIMNELMLVKSETKYYQAIASLINYPNSITDD